MYQQFCRGVSSDTLTIVGAVYSLFPDAQPSTFPRCLEICVMRVEYRNLQSGKQELTNTFQAYLGALDF